MSDTNKAGYCLNGKRHKWGVEERMIRGASVHKNIQQCVNCSLARVIEYTRNGSHVAGYKTISAKFLQEKNK